jgi:hypothetical protein
MAYNLPLWERLKMFQLLRGLRYLPMKPARAEVQLRLHRGTGSTAREHSPQCKKKDQATQNSSCTKLCFEMLSHVFSP